MEHGITTLNGLPDGQFKYFYYNPEGPDESGQKIKIIAQEGEGHLDENKEEVFLDSGILAGTSLKLDDQGQLVMGPDQTYSKTGDEYSTVVPPEDSDSAVK